VVTSFFAPFPPSSFFLEALFNPISPCAAEEMFLLHPLSSQPLHLAPLTPSDKVGISESLSLEEYMCARWVHLQ